MNKWVNFSVLIEAIQNKYECCGYVGEMPFEELKHFLNSVPSINIVRCGECKWYDEPHCKWHGFGVESDDFCSYGKLKGED